jgi:polysaccharide deacetylase family protein (PEP-CTERM system associated)
MPAPAQDKKITKTILLTFDVEDWFQVENFKEYIPYSDWDQKELRVEKNTLDLLDLLDAAPHPVQATFFILGWIAERYPNLVREIQNRGHEIASHGYNHHLCHHQSSEELRSDLIKSKKILEDLTGETVGGYRAPSFSISDKVIILLKEIGYLYDSSFNSFGGNERHGTLKIPEHAQPDAPIYSLSSSFYEIPVSNLRLGSRIIPWGGGGYFRLLPAALHRLGVKRILDQNSCYTFYMHPWEIDSDQPRVKEAKSSFRFRHYINLHKAQKKLQKFIQSNSDSDFHSCSSYIKLQFC